MSVPPLPADEGLVAAFRGKPTSVISDNLARLPGPVDLRLFHSGHPPARRTLTVRTRACHNLVIRQALEIVRPSDFVVVDEAVTSTARSSARS